MNSPIKKITFLSLTILITICLVGCLAEYFEDPAEAGEEMPPPDLIIALANDQSKSASHNGIPEISSAELDSIFAILCARGGELIFSNINDKVPQVLRVPLLAEQGTPHERLQASKVNDSRLRYLRHEISRALRFRDAPHTNLYRTLGRLNLALQEPHHPANAQKVLLVVSDFEDDMMPHPLRHPITLAANTVALAVAADPDSVHQVLEGSEIYLYSGIGPVIAYLKMEVKP